MTESGDPPAASAISTGGGGVHFEQHVDAMFLAMLLVQGFAPIFEKLQVRQVCLQTRDLGWHTDDVLVIAAADEEPSRKIAAQIKLGLTISENDEECRNTFSAFWADFNNSSLFDRSRDRLAVFVQQGTKTLLGSFGALLDLAHSASDAGDFQRRLEKSAATPSRYAAAIRTIISVKGVPADEEFLAFLQCVSVNSYDLNTVTATTEGFVKTLLAFTSTQADPIEAANSTWNQLLEVVSRGKAHAACYTYKDLPADLRTRHGRVTSADEASLSRLIEHSRVTVDRISDSIGGSVRIRRDALVAQINELLDNHRVVVIAGSAGSGKSALAKTVLHGLTRDVICLAFRAEEFATSHINQTLRQAQVDLSIDRLTALLAAHGRKVILIESIERLLEADVRDALKDLLAAVRKDPGIRLIVTCRDYSLATVEASLIAPSGLVGKVLLVPGFTDFEQEVVVNAIPNLRPLMAVGGLKSLLRSPYMLDMAARMGWGAGAPIPHEEFAFRSKCWSEVIRNDSAASNGLPRRREEVFMDLSIRRAKALRPFVPCEDLDAIALHELHKDGLISFAPQTDAMAAPSHDVLEDWAIIRWLDERYAVHEYSAEMLGKDLSGHPAIRRAFRKWLGELLERDANHADSFVVATIQDDQTPAYLRDDTLTAALLSETVAAFLSRQTVSLLADDSALLARAIHLLRVAGKVPPVWLAAKRAVTSQLLIPEGKAWPAVLEFVKDNISYVAPRHLSLLVGLIEDWALVVSWKDPEPAGFTAAGAIAFHLLDQLQDYDGDGLRKRILNVIVKTPTAVPDRFIDLVDRGCVRQPDSVADDFVSVILPGMNGSFACRAYPAEMVRLTKANLLMTESDRFNSDDYSPVGIERFFGMRENHSHDFFPASAARGLFAALLLHHPSEGTQLILDLANHAGQWYGERGTGDGGLEPAAIVSVNVPGSGIAKQWANGRLWQLYRGSSVGPESLKSALMALEQWLLAISTGDKVDLDSWLLFLLRESNSVAVPAVVASLCVAHPEKAMQAGLALLSCRELIWLDRQRMASEHMSSSLSSLIPTSIPEHLVYEAERKAANPLLHRHHDIESMAIKLQFSPVREEVWRLIDEHRTALPPLDSQNEADRVWRLALHRMDVRGFRKVTTEADIPGPEAKTQAEAEVAYYSPGMIEDDVKDVVDRATRDHAKLNRDLSLLNWGTAVWEGKPESAQQGQNWQAMLAAAKEREKSGEPTPEYCEGGPGLIAAVCVRDHLRELEGDDRNFCLDVLIAEIDRHAVTDDSSLTYARGIANADRCSAFAITRALAECEPAAPDPRIVTALAIALTHAIPEVRDYAIEGIGRNLDGGWRSFALRCATAFAVQARLLEEAQENRRDWHERRREIVSDVNVEVRRIIVGNDRYDETELSRIELSSWAGQVATRSILRIFATWPDSDIARNFHSHVVAFLSETWKRKRGSQSGQQRHYEFEYAATEDVARFVLRLERDEALALCSGFAPLVAEDSEDLARFLRDLIVAEDAHEDPTPFWNIWDYFRNSLRSAPWLPNSLTRSRFDSGLIRAMFLGAQWKADVGHWERLSNHAVDIESLARELPPSSTVVSAYCRFLYTIGRRSLPDAFVVVANLLKAGDPTRLLRDENTVFYLESLLGRFTYSEPLRLKSVPTTRNAILDILNDLVDAGSSAAFRMRDDFVTPASDAKLLITA